MQIEQIPLFHVNMWVQVHDLPTGLMKEKFGIPLANYIGNFMEYDKNNNSCFWRQYMRLRVRIDVRQPLKKETKVKNREGKWCTVKFKYEKLGIFCFVCGVMGHTENKCEVRFAMEQDDGVREWSAEIRAENRRQGGKLTSRWLRDDGGGSSEVHGGERERQSQNAAGNTCVEPTNADVAANFPLAIQNRPNPIVPVITSQQENSLPINCLSANSSKQPITHMNANDYQIITTPIHNMPNVNVNFNAITNPTLTSYTSPTHHLDLPNIYSPLTNCLTDQILSFTSQPLTRAPHPSRPTINRATRVSTNAGVLTRPNPETAPHPFSTRIRPDKKTKKITQKPNPTQNHTEPPTTQLLLKDMDSQTEKKRRREEVVADIENSEEVEHFLTAGPGSQACRDQ
jgi:hypothetical protein